MRKILLLLLCTVGCGRTLTAPVVTCTVETAVRVEAIPTDTGAIGYWYVCPGAPWPPR